RDTSHAAQGNAATSAMVLIACGGGGTKRHTVKAVSEGNDVLAASYLASQLHGRFDSVGAGRASELHAVIHFARRKDVLLEGFQEFSLRAGMHVQSVSDAVSSDIVQKRLLADGIVMAVVQRAGAGQKVDVALSLCVVEPCAFSSVENDRERAGIGLNVGFQFLEDGVHGVIPLSVLGSRRAE